MLPKNELNSSQRSTPTDPEVAAAKRDLPRDELLNNSIQTGTSTLIYLFFMRLLRIEEESPASSTLLAWSSLLSNKIRIIELESKQEFANFDGVNLRKVERIFILIISGSKLRIIAKNIALVALS